MASGTEIGSAYLTVKAKPDDSFAADIGDMGSEAGELFTGKFGALMGKLPGILAAVGIAAAVGKELFDIGASFDAMRDKIIIGTGASGEALDSLVQSAKNISTTVPADFEQVGDVVQNLNTRLGITGQNLEDLSSRVIAAGNMLETEINLDSLTGSLNAFGVSNEDAAAKMDYLFNVGQATGIEFNQLTGILEANAPTLQNLGFSFEEAANMAGLLDKAGMDASGTMSKMSRALVELSEPGESAADAYRRVIEEMQGYIEAGDTASAMDIASKVFGTKGAAQFVGALQSGALSMDQLTDATLGAGDGIMATMQKTMSWEESWQILQNSVKVALEPLAVSVFDGISNAIANVTSFVQENQAAFDSLGKVLGVVANILSSVVGGALNVVGGLLASVGNAVGALSDMFTSFMGNVKSVFDNVVNIVTGAINAIKNVFNFRISLPHIPLPHFGINPPGWQLGDLLKGSIPSLAINWYAQGGIVSAPTLIGAGEEGPEAIVPLTDPNIAPFADAVAARIHGGGDTFIFNVTADSETTLQRLVQEAQRARLQYA